MIISGGRDHSGLLDDAHVYNFESETWSSLRTALLMEVRQEPAPEMEKTGASDSENEAEVVQPPSRPATKASMATSVK